MDRMLLSRKAEEEQKVNFELNEDEEMLKAVVERFVADRYDVERRRSYLNEEAGYSADNWSVLAELGVLAVPFSDEDGGLGLDATALSVIFQALGAGIVVEPVLESAILPGLYIAAGLAGDLRDDWVAGLISGERRVAMARQEMTLRDPALPRETTVRSNGDDVTIEGEKAYAIAGGMADGFIVSAIGEDGVEALFLIPADAEGLDTREWRLADGSFTASLTLEGVTIPASNRLAIDDADQQRIETLASLARSSEALGIMGAMFNETLEYLRTREQFGMPLGKFQAVQHRMAGQYALLEQSRALIELAVVSENSPEFAANTDGARAFIAENALELGHEMIQLHGGMGVTDELAIGQGHKRLLVLSRWPEAPLVTLDRYAGAL
ncbi:acyl-CoA dehydrogenase family protein [Croceicoccus mobilis]|nr:acyl-CoA dehydrogenase [Croceicoccus mobilis]